MATPGDSNPICVHCGLWAGCRTPFMNFHGGGVDPRLPRKILIVGEAPGMREDWVGFPFVTQKDFGDRNKPGAGDLLWKELKRVGIKRFDCVVQNAARCHPENNKLPVKAVKHCRQFLLDDIEAIKPRAILLLGAKACDSVLKRKTIGKCRMQRFSYSLNDGTEIPVVAAYHPAFVMRELNQMQRFRSDLEFFKQVIDGKEKTIKLDALLYPTFKQLEEYLDYFQTSKHTMAFDFETNTLHPARGEFTVLCCGFSDGVKTIVVPYDIDWLSTKRHSDMLHRARIRHFLRRYLESKSIKKCAHYANYDMHVARCGLGIDVKNVISDTMLLHSFQFPMEGGHDLDNVASELLGTGKYKDLMKKYIGDGKHPEKWLTIPYHVLANRCSQDAYVTACCERKMQFRLKSMDGVRQRQLDAGQKMSKRLPSSVYKDIIMPGMHALYEVERHGILIDKVYNKKLSAMLGNDIDARLKQLRSSSMVRRFENDRYQPILAEEKQRIVDGKRKRQPGVMQRKFQDTLFKPNSSDQVSEILYSDQYFNLTPDTKQLTQGGSVSVSAEWMDQVIAETKNATVREFCEEVQTYKQTRTEKKTFVDRLCEFTDRDNRVHTSFHQGRARTGRLSSTDPNLQNVKRGSRVRKQFIAAPGHVLINLDYSQIELRVLAAFSKDKKMIEMFNSGHDIHEETARGILRVKGDVSEDQRVVAKGVNFGVVYGETEYGLSRNINKSIEECQAFIRDWFVRFPAVKRWQNRVMEYAMKHGRVYTMFGRSRIIENAKLNIKRGDKEAYRLRAEALRMAINTPVQGTASDFCLIALTFLVEVFKDGFNSMSFVELTVHDSIVIEALESKAKGVALYARGLMEVQPLRFLDGQFKDIPIVVDVSMGKTWGDLKEVAL